MCFYCQSFNHDVNSYPYYDVFNECHARLDVMIGTMNEQHEHLVSVTREYGLLHETDPSRPCPSLEVDDCESSLPVESNVVDDTPLTDLGEVFIPLLTSLSFIAL